MQTRATSAVVSPATAETPVGLSGTVAGVTAVDASDGSPSPTALVATTVNVYEVPLARPVTWHVTSDPLAVVQVLEPSSTAVTV